MHDHCQTLNTTDNLHPAVADDDGFGAGPGRAGFDLAVQAAEEDQLMPPPDDGQCHHWVCLCGCVHGCVGVERERERESVCVLV